MKCGECLMNRVEMVPLDSAGVCPKCGADYRKERAKYEKAGAVGRSEKPAMQIIRAVHDDGRPVSEEVSAADRPEPERQHKRALEQEPTWGAFGGEIRIGDRRYQVG
jgi:hypothetical protein